MHPSISIRPIWSLFLALILTLTPLASGQEPQLVDGGVLFETSKETTTLDRETQRLESRLLVTVRNNGTALISPPLHLVLSFNPLEGNNLEGLQVPGTLGGLDEAPYQTFYLDCSAKTGGDGLAPGEHFETEIRFSRPRTLMVRYEFDLAGVINLPPEAVTGGPYRGTAGEPLTLDASGSSDPEEEALTYLWTLPDGSTLDGPTVQASFDAPGIQQVRLKLTDERGGTTRELVEIIVLPGGEFALGRTRVLDGLGHPLGEIEVTETGPGGIRQFPLREGGFSSLGSVPGDYLWRFEKSGYLAVCRRATLLAGEVIVLPNPWLPLGSLDGIPLSVINDTSLANPEGTLRLLFPGGAFTQATDAFLTELGDQTLPGPLPLGWSPLRAFHLALPQDPLQAGTLTAILPAETPPDRPLVLAFFDESSCEWMAKAALTLAEGSVTAALSGRGSFAILLADADPTAPPAATPGAPLPGFLGEAQLGGLTASGTLEPDQSIASLVSGEVTARATVHFTGQAALPSGTWFQSEVREQYALASGESLLLPDYDQSYYVYRHWNPDPRIVTASFPVRPTLLFGPEELNMAEVHIRVLGRVHFRGGVIDPGGGVLTAGPFTVSLPANAVDAAAAAGLRLLDSGDIAALGQGFALLGAFALDLGELAEGTELGFSYGDRVTPDASFVLARLVSAGKRSGLQPVLRLASDSAGTLRSIEPTVEPRLDGLRGPGTYLLLQSPGPLALIHGRTLRTDTTPLPGAATTVVATPWLALSDMAGRYELVALQGPGHLLAQDLRNGDAGTANFLIDGALSPLALDLTIRPAGPSVLATSPPSGSADITRVTPVSVTFSEALDPASFGPDAIVLVDANTSATIPGTLSLSPGNQSATLLPTNPLAYNTDYIIDVAATITDPGGLPLEGNRLFGFKTEAAPVRSAGAQLVIYEPGAALIPQEVLDDLVGYRPGIDTHIVVATGSPGTVDPEVPVILVNDITGATATVLSKPDGSFSTFIEADEEDFIAATFVNTNGSRIRIPATRQLFDSGKIGLYKAGGILEAESDGLQVQVFIEPEAIASRTTFQVSPVPLATMLELVGGVQPKDGKLIAGINYAEGVDPITLAADVAISVDPDQLGLPEGAAPEDAAFALTIPRKIGGVVVYEVIDKMHFVVEPDGSTMLKTASPPFLGLLLRELSQIQANTPVQDGLAEARTNVLEVSFPPVPGSLGLAFDLANTFAAILISVSANVIATGTVEVVEALADGVDPGPEASGTPLAGAFITFESSLLSSGNGFPDASNIIAAPFLDGQTIATTRANGHFSLITNAFVVGGGGSIRARHPRFPFQKPKSAGVFTNPFAVTIFKTDLRFLKPNAASLALPDEVGPELQASHFPPFPIVGEEANLNLIAVDDVSISTLNATVTGFIEFGSGRAKETDLVTLTEVSNTQPAPPRLLKSYTLSASEPGLVRLALYTVDGQGKDRSLEYTIPVGTGGFGESSTVPRGVVLAWPPDKSKGIATFTPLFLRFNKPLPEDALTDLSIISQWLTLSSGFSITLADVSPDRREITLYYDYTGDPGGQALTVTLNSTVIDPIPAPASGGGGTSGGSFSYTFTFADTAGLTLPGGIVSGGGVVMTGSMAYAISRSFSSATPEKIIAIDLSNPAMPQVIDEEGTFGRPTDLAIIPAYPLARKVGTETKFPVKDYLAVFSGDSVGFKVLELYELDPSDGSMTNAYQSVLTREVAQVIKTKWDPPFLAFLELSASTTNQIQLMDLNAFTIAKDSTNDQIEAFPEFGTPGIDLNFDGDYADPGDTPPGPAGNALFFGQAFSYAPTDPLERIVDFDFDAGFGLLGALFKDRLQMVLGGSRAELLPETASVSFPQRGKRMRFLPNASLFDGSAEIQLDLALVSTGADSNGESFLILIDVTDPDVPTILKTLKLPAGSGSAGSITERSDGLLALATSSGAVLLLEPRQLLRGKSMGFASTTAPDELGAVVGVLSGMGSGIRSFVSNDAGVSVVNGGGNQRILFTGPRVGVITMSEDPETIDSLKALDPIELMARLETAQTVVAAETSPFHLLKDDDPTPDPDPKTHFYLMVRAPGGSGEKLKLSVAATNRQSDTLLPGITNAVPTQLASDDTYLKSLKLVAAKFGAGRKAEGISDFVTKANEKFDELEDDDKGFYPDEIEAQRLSDSPTSDLYNTYLAGPLVLLPKAITKDRFDQLQGNSTPALQNSLERFYLRATPQFWLSLDPEEANNVVLGDFVTTLDSGFGMIDVTVALSEQTITTLDALKTDKLMLPGANHLQRVAFGRNPIVFIPGIAGSYLASTSPKKDLWINTDIFSFLTDEGREFLEKLALGPLKPDPDPMIESRDAIRTITKLGVSKDIYHPFLKMLRDELLYPEYDFKMQGMAGLDLNQSPNWDSMLESPELFVFPYDWRQDNAKSAEQLKNYIDLVAAVHPGSQVDIIAHSMGGLVARRYIIDNPDRVDRLITLGTPFLGAPKTIPGMYLGDFDDFALNALIPKKVMRKVGRYSPAVHQLLPSEYYFKLGGSPLVESGWDTNEDGNGFETYNYESYKKTMDDFLFPDEDFVMLDGRTVPGPKPMPIKTGNKPFHSHSMGDNRQDDWHNDDGSVRYFHIVGMQFNPQTITRVRLDASIIPNLDDDDGTLEDGEKVQDISLSTPPVEFFDSESVFGNNFARIPDDPEDLPIERTVHRLDYNLVLDRGAGDGTVPLLSAARGYKSDLDLNAPNALVIPLVSREAGDMAEEVAGHNDMLKVDSNDDTRMKTLIERILDNNLDPEEDLPKITYTGASTVQEGSALNFSATVEKTPDGADPSSQQFLWDVGDAGRIVSNPSGSYVYPDNGTYTLTCVVGYDTEAAALLSKTITVTNVAPTLTLQINPTNPKPFEPVTITATVTDPGRADLHTFTWDLGDDSDAGEGLDPGTFRMKHRYTEEGTFTVQVKVEDDDGGTSTQTKAITVSSSPSAPGPSPIPPPSGGPPSAPQAASEYVTIFLSGHQTDDDNFTVKHGEDSIFNFGVTKFFLDKLASLVAGETSGRQYSMQIFREPKRGETNLPANSSLGFKAKAKPRVTARMIYYKNGTAQRCFRWAADVQSANAEITLKIPWDKFEDGLQTIDSIEALLSASGGLDNVTVLELANCDDQKGPSLNLSTDPRTGHIEIAVNDDTTPSGEIKVYLIDITELEGQSVKDATEAKEPIKIREEDASTLELRRILPNADGKHIINGYSVMGRSVAILAEDKIGNVTIATSAPSRIEQSLASDQLAVVRNAIKTAYLEGSMQPFFQKFVISLDDLLIFEQGSGACLWKNNANKCANAYSIPGSDNDYEMFFPVFLGDAPFLDPPGKLDPTDVIHQVTFEENAYRDLTMAGDWYFKLPEGLDSEGNSLGFPPDLGNKAQLAPYLNAVAAWRYTLPPTFQTLAGETSFEVLKGKSILGEPTAKSVFNNPVSPSSVVSFVLTENLKKSTTTISGKNIRKILPDVSFFPYRREHFEFAVMSLERPPPFGDDPIGDAGMGRGLLLLKWVLEGAFLPEFDGFNTGFDAAGAADKARRTAVFDRLVARSDSLEVEGYEWGIYQEFAALSESVHLRVRRSDPEPQDGNPASLVRERQLVFGDYFMAHDKKAMKKVGKAAIRSVLARMAAEDAQRPQLFAMTPEQFDAETRLASFEHLVADLGKANLSLFSGITAQDMDNYLNAKIGNFDDKHLKEILQDPETVDEFITKGMDLIRVSVQEPTEDDYADYLKALLQEGNENALAECNSRLANNAAVNFGLTTSTGEFKPGRFQLHGELDAADLSYSFVLNLHNHSDTDPAMVTVKMDPGLGVTDELTEMVDIPAGGTFTIKKKNDANPGFFFKRPANVKEMKDGSFVLTLNPITEATEANKANDELKFEHEIINLDFRKGLRPPELQVELEYLPTEQATELVFTMSLDGQSIEGTYFRMVDNGSGGLNQLQIPNGRLRVSANHTLLPHPEEYTVIGISSSMVRSSNSFVFSESLADYYVESSLRQGHGRSPSEGERTWLEVFHQNTFTATKTLIPHVRIYLDRVMAAPDLATLTPILDEADIQFSTFAAAEILINEMLQLPQQTAGVPGAYFQPINPGRQSKVTGQVLIHSELEALALAGLNASFSPPTPPRIVSAFDVIRDEVVHELNYRIFSRMVGQPFGTQIFKILDINLIKGASDDPSIPALYPGLEDAFDINTNDP